MPIRLLLICLLLYSSQAVADAAIWRLLDQGGHVVLMRHATTQPGIGDPPGFRLDDCATQRNLSYAGRDEARRIGNAFVERDILVTEVLSSAWCRCLETARLAFGRALAWRGANSFFDNTAEREQRTDELRRRVVAHRGPGNLVVVTHQVNILALAGVGTAMAEMVVLTPDRNGGFTIAGKLRPN